MLKKFIRAWVDVPAHAYRFFCEAMYCREIGLSHRAMMTGDNKLCKYHYDLGRKWGARAGIPD